MSKWRPRKEGCLYVIPDIHGANSLLELILKRILPLRKKDKIVFLGDYIDRGKDSHLVIDKLINLKKEYKEQVICLMGNHELMILEGLNFIDSAHTKSQLDMWLSQGGKETLYGYAERKSLTRDPLFSLNEILSSSNRMKRLIPQNHIDFFMSLEPYFEQDNFVFVHGGCHPTESPKNYDVSILCWDRSLLKLVETLIKSDLPLEWKKTIITGHNTRQIPVIKDNFMMLDIGSPKKLLAVEVYTREAYLAQPNKNRLVKFELKETKKAKHTKSMGTLVKRR